DGKVWQTLSAGAYYEQFDYLVSRVMAAYNRLASMHDFIVIEGAGSVAEVNLKSRDLVNLGLALRVESPVLLVADIDRGGVFASLIGTMELLTKPERALVRGFAINRFRGDRKLFEDGVTFLEDRMRLPCLGVFAMAPDIRIDAEDAVSLDETSEPNASIAAIHFPHISNFTDLERLPVRWLREPDRRLYSHVILPGTKNTLSDLEWLRSRGLDAWLRQQHAAGAILIGVCGGYQMLGESIDGQLGLGMLPVRTSMRQEKLVRRVTATSDKGSSFDAYEIHMGETEVIGSHEPLRVSMVRAKGFAITAVGELICMDLISVLKRYLKPRKS
ncbi:MAG: cobyric acid synthase, partial [Bryobacteraceae bacterium]